MDYRIACEKHRRVNSYVIMVFSCGNDCRKSTEAYSPIAATGATDRAEIALEGIRGRQTYRVSDCVCLKEVHDLQYGSDRQCRRGTG